MYDRRVKVNIYMATKLLICSILIFSLALSNFFGANISAQAAEKILYVNNSATGANNGSSWKDAFTELQSALDEAGEGNEIWIAEGIYYPTKDIKGNASPSDARTKSFQMKNGVSIYGGFPANDLEAIFEDRDVKQYQTILSGDLNKNGAIDDSDAYHVFYHPQGTFINGTALLDGVVISGGNANSYSVIDALNGGGMFNNRSHPKLSEVIIGKNQAESNGGGIYNENSNMHFENGVINGNSSNTGAGFYNTNGNPVLSNVEISENTSQFRGGGIYSQSGKLTISKGTIAGNTAGSFGGGLNLNGESQLDDLKVLNNKARSGAGMYIQGNSIVMENGEISGNIAAPTESGNGGGIYSAFGWSSTFENVDIHENEAHSGGGIHLESGSDVYINTSISNNKASNGAGVSIMSGNPKFVESDISKNIAAENGGGVLNNTAQPIFTNTAITSNIAKNGAGIYSSEGSITSLNTSFQGNEAMNNGGALYNYNSDLLFTNTLISGNKAVNGGGFYENYADASKFTNVTIVGNNASKGGAFYNSASNPILQNSIIWNNGDAIHNSGSTPSFAYSLVQGSGGSDSWNNTFGKNEGRNLDVDPKFVDSKAPSSAPTSDGNYSLASNSGAIDKGNNEFVPKEIIEDLNGNYRKMGTSVGLGAYEVTQKDNHAPYWEQNGNFWWEIPNPRSIRIHWNPAQDNHSVTGYRIYLDNKLIEDLKVGKDPINFSTEYSFKNLNPNTTYEFSVEAYDEAMNTSMRLRQDFRTDIEPDNESPIWLSNSDISISEVAESGLHLTWPTANDNVGIHHYNVTVKETGQVYYFTDTEARIYDLAPDSEYEFSINAFDAQGNKSDSITKVFKTLPVWPEDGKINFRDVTQSSLSLVLPKFESGLFTSIEFLLNDERWDYYKAEQWGYSIANLKPGTEYKFTVRIYNHERKLLKEIVEKSQTAPYSDQEPPYWKYGQEIKAKEIKETSLKILWPKAIDNEGIKGYRIFVDNEEVADVDSSKTEYVIADLTKGTTYTVMVQAYDEKGNAAFIRLGVQTASSSGGGSNGGGQVIVLPPVPSIPQEPVTPPVIVPTTPIPSEPEKPEAPEEPALPNLQLVDIKGHWAEKQIVEGIQKKMINGYLDNTFKPDNQINRAEFTILLANALGLSGDGEELDFNDNSKIGPSARTAIKRALKAGLVHGFEDGSFRPTQKITRMEMAAMIARAMDLKGDAKASTGFSDDSSIPTWARGAIGAMKETGVISGRSNNKFEPTVNATRAETVVMLLRMMKYEED